MQIGIDLGATKIEYVLLDNDNIELKRDRVQTPKDYENTIISITEIVKKLENKSGKFNVGICHPGAVDKTTGLIKNAHNSQWLNNKNLIKDLKLKIDNNFLSENDANCFCLSEAFDGSASHYETVFGIIKIFFCNELSFIFLESNSRFLKDGSKEYTLPLNFFA